MPRTPPLPLACAPPNAPFSGRNLNDILSCVLLNTGQRTPHTWALAGWATHQHADVVARAALLLRFVSSIVGNDEPLGSLSRHTADDRGADGGGESTWEALGGAGDASGCASGGVPAGGSRLSLLPPCCCLEEEASIRLSNWGVFTMMISIFAFCTGLSRPASSVVSRPVMISACAAAPYIHM